MALPPPLDSNLRVMLCLLALTSAVVSTPHAAACAANPTLLRNRAPPPLLLANEPQPTATTPPQGGAVPPRPPPPPIARAASRLARLVDAQFFLFGVVAAVALGALLPGATTVVPALKAAVSWGAPCGIFLITGLNLPSSALAAAAVRARAHAAIQLFNLGLVPLAALGVVRALGVALPASLADGLLATAALPTTVNMCVALTRQAGGTEALAVFNAVLGNLLGIVVSPLLLFVMVGQSGAVPVVAAIRSILIKVLLPLLAGQLLRQPAAVRAALPERKKALSRASELLLLLTIFATFSDTFARGFGVPNTTLAALIAGLGAAYAVSVAAAWQLSRALPHAADRPAFVYTSTHKTLALGLPLLRIVFADRPDLGALCTPLLVQHPLQLLAGSFMAPRLATYVKSAQLQEQTGNA